MFSEKNTNSGAQDRRGQEVLCLGCPWPLVPSEGREACLVQGPGSDGMPSALASPSAQEGTELMNIFKSAPGGD